ncbi:MAG: sugar phosphate isomerase/epimerase family protein [Phycisphaerae bacterium]
MDRRQFLKTSLVGAGMMAGLRVAGDARAEEQAAVKPVKQAVLKLCGQDGLIPGGTLKEKAERILEWGGCGLEFGGMDANRAKQIKGELEGTGCGVAALCWGYFPLIDPDEAKRKKGVEDLKHAVEVAAEAGSTGVIFIPAFNNHPQLNWDDGLKALADLLPAVGDYAVKLGTRVLLEPLNKGEARFMNRLEQAVEICKASKSPGICLMGDFYHMCKEETDDEQAVLAADGRLHHIHLASRIRWLPGQDQRKEPNKPERSFVDGFRGLKKIGYQDYCSLECHVEGDPMVEIPKSFAFLKSEWEKATV